MIIVHPPARSTCLSGTPLIDLASSVDVGTPSMDQVSLSMMSSLESLHTTKKRLKVS